MAPALTAKLRDTSWIRNAPERQIQHTFKHAKSFGFKENWNKKSSQEFREVLEKHIKSADTKVIRGTYQKEPATHYYNSKTRLNIIRKDDNLVSGWKLEEQQIFHIEKNGSLGGSK